MRDPGFSNVGTSSSRSLPVQAGDDVECALCGGLGIDVSTDAALVSLGFIADGLFPNGIGAEANLEIGQGSGDDSDDEYDPGDFLGKTAGYGSDYRVLWGSLHARYPVPVGDNDDLTLFPLAGLGYYRWTENDCEDPFDAGSCDPYTDVTLDIGAEVKWQRIGFRVLLPIGDAPDMAFRVRYHLPIGKSGD